MNDEIIVQNMIEYIEEKERGLQASKLLADNHAKTDIVQSILKELENQLAEEDGNED